MIKLFAVLLIIGAVSAGERIQWWNIKAAQQQGPNVCVVEQDPDTQRKYYTECKYWRPRSICGKQTITKYECCEGFRMIPGHKGCMGVEPLVDVVETARRLGAEKFANLLEQSGVARELDQGPAVTLFAPSDESFDAYLKLYGAMKTERITEPKYKNLAMYHLVNNRILSNQWGADSLIESKLPGVKIRINKYSNGMETVNCEPVLRKNQQATNGVVHIIDGVLLPDRYQNLSIVEAITIDGRFNVLAKILNGSNVAKRLVNDRVPHTFFAPSDEAFQKLPRARLDRILADKDAREALIANHVVVHPICLPGIISEHRVKTIGPHKLSLNCTSRGGPTIEKRKVRQDFLNGPDGLVYLLDDVILPDKAQTVTELVDAERLVMFAKQIRNAGLEEIFENFKPYTLFVPSEAAMYSISQGELEYMERDLEKAKEFVLNHAVFGKHTAASIYDNQVVTSLDEKTPLRLQVYRGSIGIEDATIEKADIEGSNGVLHVINKVLRPNNNSLDEVLRTNGNFSIWLEAMDKMLEIQPREFNEFRQSPTRTTAYTYFVPSDEAFRELGDVELRRLMGNSTYLSETLKNHMVDDMMTLNGFKRDLQYAVQTKQNTVDIVKRNDVTKVNGGTLKKCDMLNRNGVAHEINKVLLPQRQDRSQRWYSNKRHGVIRTGRIRSVYSFNSNNQRNLNSMSDMQL